MTRRWFWTWLTVTLVLYGALLYGARSYQPQGEPPLLYKV